MFAVYLAEPLTDIINTSLKRGEYPQIYKFEVSTPVPKVKPTQSAAQLRNISELKNFDKVMEKLVSELIISDMENSLDKAQYGNQRGLSIQHYLVKMVHRILTVVDKNSTKEKFAVLVNLVDWNNAFPRQCPKLGIESFLRNGVRPSLIPFLMNYFQGRQMSVRWQGAFSEPRTVNGGTPQGASFGNLGYMSQSNNNVDMIPEDDKFKFVDDLSTLEVINLLSVGIASFNFKLNVADNVPLHNQIIPASNLKSQQWLSEINDWTEKQKGLINEKKTKTMIFNYTQDFQFTTNLKLKGESIEVIKSTKLLGTIISDDLKWNLNTANLVKKANLSMEILRRIASFGAPVKDLKQIYFLFVRSLLEQSAVVWHSGLSQDNTNDLERVQKSAVKIILGNEYTNYENALSKLGMTKLSDRRDELCLKFASKCLKNKKTKDMFPENKKTHKMKTRKSEKYFVQMAATERLKRSPIIYMQTLLNKDDSSQS